MSKLAIKGGNPVRTVLFPSQNTMDCNEATTVLDVMRTGRLSGYRAGWGKEFWGGPYIQQLEKEWKEKFKVKHAIPCNSATSGLQIACGAIGLGLDDEVIVTPYSMTCSATAPMIWRAKPIFADIEPDFYCLDPKSVEERITSKTKAIIAVDLFGQPYSWEINKIAKKHNLMVIEDAAQAIGSTYENSKPFGKYSSGTITIAKKTSNYQYKKLKCAGTLGDIGVYSFNYGKHITCGEGGMMVTDSDELAMRCRLIMNHAEAVINDMGYNQLPGKWDLINNMIGFNMRMTELQAAIISEQLKKFDDLLQQRLNNVQILMWGIEKIPPIIFSRTRPGCSHSYYVCSFQWDNTKADGIQRNNFINAVKAELPPRRHRESEDVQIGTGYIKPIYLMPIFQKPSMRIMNYSKGSCPICEDLWENKLFLTILHAPNSTPSDMQDVVKAFEKCWEYREELR